MSVTPKAHVGFVGSSAPASPHHESFKAFIPRDIDFTIVQEAGPKTSLYDARGKVEPLIQQVRELIAQQKWNGVIISGAPKKRSIRGCGSVFPRNCQFPYRWR